MKTKRVLALLLSVLLIAAMLPMQAFAAGTQFEPGQQTGTGQDTVTIDIKVTDQFGSDSFGTDETNGGLGITSTADIVTNGVTATMFTTAATNKAMNGYDTKTDEEKAAIKDAATSAVQANFANANGLVKDAKTSVTVSPSGATDSYVFIPVKFKLDEANKQDQKGITVASISLIYDSTAFEHDSTNMPAVVNPVEYKNCGVGSTNVNNLKKLGLQDYFSTVGILSGANEGLNGGVVADITKVGAVVGDASSAQSATGLSVMKITLSQTNKMFYITPHTTWDVVIPLKVTAQAEAGKTYKIGIAPYSEDTAGLYSHIDTNSHENGSTANLTAGGDPKAYKYGAGAALNDKMTVNYVSVKIDGPSITSPAIIGTGATTIDVTANKFEFTADAATATNWTLNGAGFSNTNPTSVERKSNTLATLTLPASTLTAGTLTITANTTATGQTADMTTTTEVKAAPTATYDYANNKVTTTATQAVEFQVKGDTAWTEIATGANKEIALTADQLTKLNSVVADGATEADAIKLRWKEATDITGTLSVTKGAAPGALTIDYENTQTNENVPATVEYKGGSVTNYKDGEGAKIAVEPGNDITYRTKATASAMASGEKTLTVKAAPTLTVTDATTAAEKVEGKTKVTATPNPTGLKVQYQKNSDAYADLPNDGVIAATTADTLKFKVPASNADEHFASEEVTDFGGDGKGKGNAFGTVTWTNKGAAAVGTTEVVLTVQGGAWASDVTGVKVTVDTDTTDVVTNRAKTSGDTVLTLTIPAMEKGKTYKVTVPSAAVTTGLTGGTDFTDSKKISSDSVKITVTNADVSLDINEIASGETETITASGTGMEGKKITAVSNTTAANGSVALVTGENKKFTYTAKTITGELTDTVTLTLDNIQVAYDKTTASMEFTGGTDVTFTPSNAADVAVTSATYSISGEPNGVTIDADTGVVTADNATVAKGKYEMTVTAPNTTTVKLTLNVTGPQAVPVFTGYSKTWDGTDAVEASALATITFKKPDGTAINGLTAGGEIKYKSTDVGEDIELDMSGLTISGATAGNYELNLDETYTADIDKAPFNTASATKYSKTANKMTVAALATELMKQKVTPTTLVDDTVVTDTTTDVTLGALVGDDASVIEDLLIAWLEENQPQGEGETAVDNTAEIKAKAEIELQVTGDKITKADGDFANIEDVATDEFVTVTATLKKPSPTPEVSVDVDTKDLGTADGEVVVDAEGKVESLPTVENVKKGIVFKCWSTDGTVEHQVVVGSQLEEGDVLVAVYEGYMNGYTDENGVRTGEVDKDITRAELATLLVRAAGLYDPTKDYPTSFWDAKGEYADWYTPYIGCAEDAGILTGYGDGSVQPKKKVSRNEAAIMIAKAFGIDPETTTDKIADFDQIPSWAKGYVAALCNNGTISGYKDGDSYVFRGGRYITRGEASAMVNKYLGLTEEKRVALTADTTVTSPFADVQDRSNWAYAHIIFATLSAPADYYSDEFTVPTL